MRSRHRPFLLVAAVAVVVLVACGRGQAPACAAYEECLELSCSDCDPVGDPALFGAGGACWSGTVDEARNCELACLTALDDACSEYREPRCCAVPEHVYSG